MLEVTRERLYGGPLHHGAKHVYRARVGSEDVANGETRTEATDKAWSAIADALNVRWVRPEIGRTQDGDTCVAIQAGARQYTLYWFNADCTGRGGCESGRLELSGERCSLAEYVRHSVLMRDGMDYYQAAIMARKGEA